MQPPAKSVAVIFVAQRNGADEEGYARAAVAMDAAAAAFPGYVGMDSTRGPDGLGITVSYWADDAAARAWKADPAHTSIREQGRGRWYDWYDLTVAEVTRGYRWRREGREEPRESRLVAGAGDRGR